MGKKKDEIKKSRIESIIVVILLICLLFYVIMFSSSFYSFIKEIIKSTLNVSLNFNALLCVAYLSVLILLIYNIPNIIRIPDNKSSKEKFYVNIIRIIKKIKGPYILLTIIMLTVFLLFGLSIYGQYYKNELPKTINLLERDNNGDSRAEESKYTIKCSSLNDKYNYFVEGDSLECIYNVKGEYDVYAQVYSNDFSKTPIYSTYSSNGEKIILIELKSQSIRGIDLYMNLTIDNQSKEYSTYLFPTKIISKDNAESKENQKLTTLFAIISLSIISVIIAVKNLKDIIEDK